MKTIEKINGRDVAIEWDFNSPFEEHDNHWCCWHMEGLDANGNKYLATCQGDKYNPENSHSDIEDIEIN